MDSVAAIRTETPEQPADKALCHCLGLLQHLQVGGRRHLPIVVGVIGGAGIV